MITFRRKGEDVIGNGLFRVPKKKEMHCMYGRVGEGGSDCIIEIRIPPYRHDQKQGNERERNNNKV